jgi:poly(hydroxyalkanoate) depolymerase family esterase
MRMTPAEEAIARWMRQGRAFAEQAMDGASSRLANFAIVGSNPGALEARCYLPKGPTGAPLVVVLHGCTQTAAGFDRGSGWSMLAERHGFALLYPEQTQANNANLCFNWFQPRDIKRDSGEVLSIRQAIETMIAAHGLDRRRVFITGLSAGGAMTAAMIATYPELFAGAAIIAGLPYGCAKSLPEAMERMAGRGYPEPEVLTRMVTSASHHRGPWPTVSVWQGSADRIVVPANAGHIVDQWRGIVGAGAMPDRIDVIGRHRVSRWHDGAGRTLIARYDITGLDHGVPLGDGLGEPGPYMLEAGISSSAVIARGWGLMESLVARNLRRAPPSPG